MTYEVGDTVWVISAAEVRATGHEIRCNVYNEIGYSTCRVSFVDRMFDYCGQQARISRGVITAGDEERYELDIDDSEFTWSKYMLKTKITEKELKDSTRKINKIFKIYEFTEELL